MCGVNTSNAGSFKLCARVRVLQTLFKQCQRHLCHCAASHSSNNATLFKQCLQTMSKASCHCAASHSQCARAGPVVGCKRTERCHHHGRIVPLRSITLTMCARDPAVAQLDVAYAQCLHVVHTQPSSRTFWLMAYSVNSVAQLDVAYAQFIHVVHTQPSSRTFGLMAYSVNSVVFSQPNYLCWFLCHTSTPFWLPASRLFPQTFLLSFHPFLSFLSGVSPFV